MKITNNEVFTAYNYIADLKLTKFSKETRVAIYKNMGELAQAIKNMQEKIETSQKALFKDLEEDGAKVKVLRDEYNNAETAHERKDEILSQLQTYTEYLKAESEYAEVINNYGNDEVEVSITCFDFNDFVDGLAESNMDFSAVSLRSIDFMFNNI